jgi:hypothetical protein
MAVRDNHWLLRAQSSQLFFISSIAVFVVGLFMLSLSVLYRNGVLQYVNNSNLFVGICFLVACIAVCAGIYLFVGMLWYWVQFDTSPRRLKLSWLASFFILGWVALAAYYFIVYRRQYLTLRQKVAS